MPNYDAFCINSIYTFFSFFLYSIPFVFTTFFQDLSLLFFFFPSFAFLSVIVFFMFFFEIKLLVEVLFFIV